MKVIKKLVFFLLLIGIMCIFIQKPNVNNVKLIGFEKIESNNIINIEDISKK